MDKVIDCIGRVLTDQDTGRLISMIEDLENVPDISVIMDLIGQKPSVGRLSTVETRQSMLIFNQSNDWPKKDTRKGEINDFRKTFGLSS